MLIVSGVFEIDPAQPEMVRETAIEMARATREEAGCISYAFYADLETPANVRVFEEWENQEALEAHFQTPHMATFRQALGAITIKSRAIWRYEVSGLEKL